MAKNCSYREGDKILQEIIKNPDDWELIYTNHFKKRGNLRDISSSYIKRMILENEPLGLLSSVDNRFKVFYPSENTIDRDLIVVIAIENNKIVLITVYEDNITKREGIR